MPTLAQASLAAAQSSAHELSRLLSEKESNSWPILMELLTDAENAIEANPNFTPAEMCYFRNRLTSCRRLLCEGEWGAACYEMTELSRKLKRTAD